MSRAGKQTLKSLMGALLALSCASPEPPAPQPQPIPQFDPSKFVICGSHPSVSEYSYDMSVRANEKILDLVKPPIHASATLSVRLDDQGQVVSVETLNSSDPDFAELAGAAVELAGPYPAPAEGMERCIRGKSLKVRVEAQLDAPCEDVKFSTEYVLSARDRIDAVIDSPEYMAQPGEGYAFLRLVFGPEGQITTSRITRSSSPDLKRKVERALAEAKPFGPPPMWAECFAEQPITLKIEALTELP